MRATNRDIAAIVLCLTLIGASVAVIVLPLLDSIPFETVDKGRSSSIENGVEYVITNEHDWKSLWADMYYFYPEVPELPLVNFTTDIIIAVFQGLRGASGETTIRRIVFNESHFVVHVDNNQVFSPLATVTWPYHIVNISGYPQDLPVEFVYTIIT
jgi:hypothetical protein